MLNRLRWWKWFFSYPSHLKLWDGTEDRQSFEIRVMRWIDECPNPAQRERLLDRYAKFGLEASDRWLIPPRSENTK